MQSRVAWIPLASGLLVLVLSLGLAVLTVTNKTAAPQDIRSQATETVGSLALSPASGDYTFSATQTIPVGIVVDSAGKNVDGVDIIIKFDPTKVQVIGTAVSPASLFERVPLNNVDVTRGQIRFSALTFNPRPVTGIVATFSFKPLAPGEVDFNFDFTPSLTTDSNIAEHGTAKDILGKVSNAKFNFN